MYPTNVSDQHRPAEGKYIYIYSELQTFTAEFLVTVGGFSSLFLRFSVVFVQPNRKNTTVSEIVLHHHLRHLKPGKTSSPPPEIPHWRCVAQWLQLCLFAIEVASFILRGSGYLSNEKKSGWLGYIRDYTTQSYRDYSKLL